ncbi:hypothetical protein [Georgenia satyanarayanai]|uniref:hypothetical protein n=1 Tax=Georgenia satyanarayanai TaxID=860221 RepID=UPI0012652DC6|nr:hypothetical protein [Georgenia satyanarayanai]
MNKRTVAVAGLFVLLTALVVWALLSGSSEAIGAVTGLSTVALVAVTAWYVSLTRDLVAAQRESIRQAAAAEDARLREDSRKRERQAAVQVWQACFLDEINWSHIKDLSASLKPGMAWEDVRTTGKALYKEAEPLEALSTEIVKLSPDLNGDVFELTWQAGAQLLVLSKTLLQVHYAITMLSKEKGESDELPTITDLRTKWTLDLRPRADGLEWEELVSGARVDVAERKLRELDQAAFSVARASARDAA